jgi:shikimate dehydrogenase
MRRSGGLRIEMIGTPIAHVRTPDLLNALFQRDGQETRVVKKRLGPRALASHVLALRQDRGVIGLVVTTPLKTAICDHLDRRTKLVELVGTANCVRFDEGAWIGANFDGLGFEAALTEAGVNLAGKRVLLAGCGGAGKAIAARIVGAKAAALAIEDGEAGKAADFLPRLRRIARGCEVSAGPTEGQDHEILVNATTLGMRRGDPSPFRRETVARSQAVVDIVIAESQSRLQRDARRLGKLFIGGTAMVRGQADLLRRFLTTGASSEAAAARAAGRAVRRGEGA